MTNKFLLWWIFEWLSESYPDVLHRMLVECDGNFGDGATSTVNKELNAAYKRYAEAQG